MSAPVASTSKVKPPVAVKPDVKRRTTKACDSCRKAKCKCTQPTDDQGNSIDGPCQNCKQSHQPCTYEASSRKRGPPKGYIEAVEQRLHRMEALLGGLIENEDPRAQALLAELIGDDEAQNIFRNDLRAAAAAGPDAPGRRSWQSPLVNVSNELGVTPSSQRGSSGSQKRQRLSPNADSRGDSIALPTPGYSNGFSFDGSLGLSMEGSSSDSEGENPAFPTQQSTSFSPSLGGIPVPPSPQRPRGLVHLQAPPKPSEIASPNIFAHQPLPSPGGPIPATIPHTGYAPATGDGPPTQLSELADVVGQLSLNEGGEIRYHGRSSGLYLISESQRYRDFFWRFPGAGVWPRTSTSFVTRSDEEILIAAGAKNALPNQATQDKLLDAYWTWVHPSLPILYRSTFMQQYRAGSLAGEQRALRGSESSVPNFLLLAIYALAARYIGSEDEMPMPEKAWEAGDDYFMAANAILAQEDLGLSRLTTVQGLLLMAYREVGMGAMARSWALVGMAIRMAQDMGLFRDVDRWYMPAAAQLSYEEKQTRKRVWWGCVILDRYVSAFIGRPMAVHERDWDTAFPSEDEPDEHDTWKPDKPVSTTVHLKSHAISTFNRSASLAVHLGRVIIQLYAIRVRVIGQSSNALLSHLDQQLARWYLSLPTHLQYTPGRKQPPSVLVLHANFYTTLLLLHRPFTPNRSVGGTPLAVPSHSIATTAANAIANIVTVYSEAYGLRRAMPQLIYYVFSAAIMHVYNMQYDPALTKTSKDALGKCMNALREMSTVWGAAARQLEVLLGLAAATHGEDLPPVFDQLQRGLKRGRESIPPSGTNTPRHGAQSPVNGQSTSGNNLDGFSDFTFNLDELFQIPAGGESRTMSGAASPGPDGASMATGPNPMFADLLDTFLAQGAGTSGFESALMDLGSVAPSPTTVVPSPPGMSEGLLGASTGYDPDAWMRSIVSQPTTSASSGLSATAQTSDLPLFALPTAKNEGGMYGFDSFH